MATYYAFVRANDDGTSPLQVAFDYHSTGREGNSLSVGTGSNEIGVYSDGFGYTVSSTYSGSWTEKMIVAIGVGPEQPRKLFVHFDPANMPAAKVKFTEFSLYKEGASDDGKSEQGGVTYYKYSMIG